MTQLTFVPSDPLTRIERVNLRPTGAALAAGEVSGHGFQRWVGEWAQLGRQGWSVAVLIERNGRSAVGLAFRTANPRTGDDGAPDLTTLEETIEGRDST